MEWDKWMSQNRKKMNQVIFLWGLLHSKEAF